MRSTFFNVGLALLIPSAALLGACDSDVNTEPSGGGGNTSTTSNTGGTTSTNPTGGSGGIGGETTTSVGGGGTGGTGGTTTSTGGSGGGVPPLNDTCPGEKIAPQPTDSLSIKGTIVGAIDNYTTFCADTQPEPGAPDVVYELVLTATSTVKIELIPNGFVPALSIRKQDCSSRPNGTACLNLGAGNINTTQALDAGTYWLVVDSADMNVGSFTLNVTTSVPTCGDGAVNPGEDCDPPTVAGDDGCFDPGNAKQCKFGEAPPDPAIIQCPGGLVTLGKGDNFALGPYNNGSGSILNTNTPVGDPADPNAPCPSPAAGPENIFQILPNANGVLTVTIGHDADLVTPYCDNPNNTCGDFIIYLRQGSCNAGTQLACDDYNPDPLAYEVLTLQTPVLADTPYWLIVDTYQQDPMDPATGYPGPYFLQVELQ